MPRLLPRISPEPPAEYIAFVEHHLDTLRRDAARVVGTEQDADHLYPDVLTDVAARWGWLKLQGRLLQPDATDLYLRRAFARRAGSWRAPDLLPLESLDEAWPVEVQVWSTGSVDPPPPSPPLSRKPASSIALRLAPHLDPTQRPQASPLAEAAVAWWHACEARRRRRRIAAGVVALVLVALTNRLPQPSTRAAVWLDTGVAVSSVRSTVSI